METFLTVLLFTRWKLYVLDGLEKWKLTSLEQATWFISHDELNAETLYLGLGCSQIPDSKKVR